MFTAAWQADFGHAAALLASAEQEQDAELSKHWTKLSEILDQVRAHSPLVTCLTAGPRLLRV